MSTSELRVFANLDGLSATAAEAVARTLNGVVRANGHCSLVLSGGHTPRTLYALLVTRWRDEVPWSKVHVFWGDERYVPHDDPRSNYRMAREALLDHVPCPGSQVHPMPTHLADPGEAARAYDATLRGYFGGGAPRFDLVLLGMGEEGHTASIFPGSPALTERTRWTLAVNAPAEPSSRLTLTMAVLTQTAVTYCLVAGADKADAVARVLAPGADPDLHPAAALQRASGTVTWWVDREAAAKMTQLP